MAGKLLLSVPATCGCSLCFVHERWPIDRRMLVDRAPSFSYPFFAVALFGWQLPSKSTPPVPLTSLYLAAEIPPGPLDVPNAALVQATTTTERGTKRDHVHALLPPPLPSPLFLSR